MSDEIVQETTNEVVESGQTVDRPRKSRKRGKRNRSNAAGPDLQAASEPTQPNVESRPVTAPPPRERERGSRRGGQRTLSNGYGDGLDRFFCESRSRFFPREWPVSHRKGLAIAPLQEVSRRGNDLLICDQLHAGECSWPDGEQLGDLSMEPAEPNNDTDASRRITPEAERATSVGSGA